MTEPQDASDAQGAVPEPPGPLFEATALLTDVLAWPGLPEALRRSLTRAVPPERLASLSFGESVRALRDPALREWIAALLALDVGVSFVDDAETYDSLIGLFARDELDTKRVARFCVVGVSGGQGFGAAYRAPSPGAPATVCAAAFVYRDAKGALEADFLFLAGATREPVVQLELAWVEGREFDERHIDHALRSLAAQVEPAHAEAARAVVREALLECRAVLDRS